MSNFYDFPSDNPAVPYTNAAVTVGTTATQICAVEGNQTGVLLYNAGSETVYLGGANVTTSGATQGYPLAASTSLLVPTYGGVINQLYGITSTSTSTINVLHPTAAANTNLA